MQRDELSFGELSSRRGVVEGMTVRSADGERLGRVVRCDPESFIIEKGFFFPKDYNCYYSQVAGIQDGEIVISRLYNQIRDELSPKHRHIIPDDRPEPMYGMDVDKVS